MLVVGGGGSSAGIAVSHVFNQNQVISSMTMDQGVCGIRNGDSGSEVPELV
uniref:Uncharacterized protein n=1 Tax=Ipomoea trifida TaxID=35884 RepID=A0PAC5_IPOTF|nr:hypothetical protein [Ipomoea trifida]